MEEGKKLKLRSEIEDIDKWNVEFVYKDVGEFEKELEKFKDLPQMIEFNETYKTKLHSLTPEEFAEMYKKYYELERVISKMYQYSHLRKDEDQGDDRNKGNFKIIQQIYTSFSASVSWIDPEIVSMASEKIEELLKAPEMSSYKTVLSRTVRMKDHTCSPEIEKLLSELQTVFSCSRAIFNQMSDTDFVFGKVKNQEGKEVTLTHGTFFGFITKSDRTLRKNAFERIHGKYGKYINTFCEIYNSVVQKEVVLSQTRHYSSALEKKLFPNAIPTSVYTNLIEATREEIGALHEYVQMRKEILAFDDGLHLYDLYVPLVKSELKKKYSFEEAVEMVCVSAKPLGEEYVKALEKGMKEMRWVDRYENKGKKSGAYSYSHYDTLPYILMNYDGNLEDIFTLCHEGGHSMHSLLSNTNQKYHYSDYSLFVAEVASIFNEQNLSEYLLSKSESTEEKLFILNKMIENFRTSFFRQVLFAEFELKVHEMAEKKTPLTPKVLSEMYFELYKFYYNDKIMTIDEFIKILYGFYVFQYATGITAATFLADKVRNGGERERLDYLEFLKSGCVEFPVDILKNAGIDLSSKEVFTKAIANFKLLVKQFKTLYFEWKKEQKE